MMGQSKDACLIDLSTPEILAGILIYAKGQMFPEQQVYAFFKHLEERTPELSGRFDVSGAPGRFRSPALRRILSFFEMGKSLEALMPNPVDQYFRPRRSQVSALERNLARRGHLPGREAVFRALASEFEEYASESSADPA
jgi:hypothetical protein